MLLKNTQARLITINGAFDSKQGRRIESFQVKPGKNPSVEVPDELCKTAFVKSLIESGALLVESSQVVEEVPEVPSEEEELSLYDGMDKAQLKALCDEAGIDYVERDTSKQLIAKLSA